MPVAGGGAFTDGVKLLPPVGLRPFSVGDGAVVVVVLVVLEGPPDSPPPQAVNAPIERRAAIPKPAAARRVSRPVMLQSYLFVCRDANVIVKR
jgi:hypothetical protein